MFRIVSLITLAWFSAVASAADYRIDPSHSFIEFRVKHLGYSWLNGRFNDVSGQFTHDAAKPQASTIKVGVDTTSLDTNHAERDKHLRADDLLHTDKFGRASFKSTGYSGTAESGTLKGMLTLHGVSRPIELAVTKIGEGADPWGGYRAGFHGTTSFDRRDFGIDRNLGPASWTVELEIDIEGIRE